VWVISSPPVCQGTADDADDPDRLWFRRFSSMAGRP
jgi:hypothetical protein